MDDIDDDIADHIKAVLNEAGNIARELNNANRGRCALTVWLCALKMAVKLAVAQECHEEPDTTVAEWQKIVDSLESLVNGVTVVVNPGAMQDSLVRTFRLGDDAKPEDRS